MTMLVEKHFEKLYLCPFNGCNRAFTSILGLRFHAKSHVNHNICPVCGKAYRNASHLYRSSDPRHILCYAALPKCHTKIELRRLSLELLQLLKVDNVAAQIDSSKKDYQYVIFVDLEEKERAIDEAASKIEGMIMPKLQKINALTPPIHALL